MRFNNKNWTLPEPVVIPIDQLPFGMKVYDGDIDVHFNNQTGTVLYYAIDNIYNWSLLGTSTITVYNGHTIYFYGPENNKISAGAGARGFATSGTGKIDLIGNLLSICNPDWTQNIKLTRSTYSNDSYMNDLFERCKDNIYNAKDLYIRTDEITSGNGTYNITFGYMFANCSHLQTAPKWICENNQLKIDRAATFISMFHGCSSLTEVELPPVTNAYSTSRTYETMLKNCTSLTKITYRGTLGINDNNFSQYIPATGDFYNLGGATYVTGNNGIPSGWTVHTTL